MSSHWQQQQPPPPDSVAADDLPQEAEASPNPYASSSRWRHVESSAYARHELGKEDTPLPHGHTHRRHVAREADSRGTGAGDLANFLNKSRLDPSETRAGNGTDRPTTPRFKPIVAGAPKEQQQQAGPPPDGREIVCGPLLNYRRMEGARWIGSVLVVTAGGGRTQPLVPTLELRKAAAAAGAGAGGGGDRTVEGTCLYSDVRNTFWRFDLVVEMEEAETKWEYELPGLRFASATKPRVNSFFVPAVNESMRIMFHSCNGFSVGTDEAAWSGPALWNDVLRKHRERPFHVMIGGGDQIYNDGIRVTGPLKRWSNIKNPVSRREHPFPESLRQECDDYYLKNYIRWYSTEPFAGANGQIPQLNIWDDHDIIDGFGSYVNEFMKCDVFRGIGGTAHKYYMLFQHHLPPPAFTYTSDAPPAAAAEEGQGMDPNQTMNAYVHPPLSEPNYICGPKAGPYVAEHSHNLFTQLGARIAFLGIDARTERTRHQVNYPETYDAIFTRLKQELSAAANSGRPFRHLVLLLGIPIAYPRLTWLENIFASPVMGPVKFLNRRFGLGGSFFNSFDGSVDLLDDLDDHYTARTHKKERNWLVERLQGICAEFSIRITILGGDVHLAALGRFYSDPRLNIPVEQDYRYIVNVISSAIVNKPPPAAVANLLARRNKIHHLNHDTSETLLKLFDKDPGDSQKTAAHNQVTMPSRNFAMITENSPNNSTTTTTTAHPNGGAVANGGGATTTHQHQHQHQHLRPPTASQQSAAAGTTTSTTTPSSAPPSNASSRPASQGSKDGKHDNSKDGRLPLHGGEENCGTKHKAADPARHGRDSDGSLDVCIWVEIDQHDPAGRTQGYGLTVPALAYNGPRPPSVDLLPPRSRGSSAAGGGGGGGGGSRA
ncbi:hypothetical protein MYCTH_2296300 [Thermothelomyces thermophilus ATCC 42464]|uniref:PhoD-like phosphatase domain-containing protein n=1 Tax=Thermothelomyces thermophilus (strain ATCC 42464 / BCRC 31852 / DSM 1799) TaxID=573729 RepID=G2Q1D5_THET4|nr:uncharacterized protein MYCTH_2296300 [Thermothelomyces thermophilus ATCC 42464]AEO54125.1 hypothetical protein MYCTH_2296300 [Thermothelomyces thermophilus ATCC 42464]